MSKPAAKRLRPWAMAAVATATLALTGCASVNFENSLQQVNAQLGPFSPAAVELAQTEEQRTARAQKAAQLLQGPLQQEAAVQLALLNSPALQALLARHWMEAASAAQAGRILNPSLSLERVTMPGEVEIGRQISLGLLDILTLPLRKEVAAQGIARAQMQLSNTVVEQITQVRQAWVKAVAAQQSLQYANQVLEAAQASAELARRMQAVGNFSKLQRARQQSFYAEAATQKAVAEHAATASREALVRALGLSESQARQLQLPARLPDLPASPRTPEMVSQAASAGRLDIRLAQASLDAAAKAQGLQRITSLVDVELGIRRDTVFDHDAGTQTARSGYEVSLKLPLFDFGELRRDAMNAQTLAAANHLEATLRAAGSNLRESYSAYRTALDIAKHYRLEVLPLRQQIADESLLRYNGMLIGVFELLAESRSQIASVMASIAAEQQFWLADAALQAAQLGRASAASVGSSSAPAAGGDDAAH